MPEFLKKMFRTNGQKTSEKYLSYNGLKHLIGKIKNQQIAISEQVKTLAPSNGETPIVSFTKEDGVKMIDVYLNGMKLFETVDYNVINNEAIHFTFAMTTENNEVHVVVRTISLHY